MKPHAITRCVLVVCCAPCLTLVSASGAELTGESDAAQVRTELWAAIGAAGEDYRQFRDRLIALGQRVVPFLKERTQRADSWQEKVMAAIILERTLQAEQIKAVVAWWSDAPRPERAWVQRWDRMGKSLAERSAQTPMLLVERIWKGNELVNRNVPPDEQIAWPADALGWLKERRALYPLIALLRDDYDPNNPHLHVATAARALGKLGDPCALPVLCKVFVFNAANSRVAVPALDAILACAGPEHIGLIQGYARLAGGEVGKALEGEADALRNRHLPKQ